jgi:hypothetical protein
VFVSVWTLPNYGILDKWRKCCVLINLSCGNEGAHEHEGSGQCVTWEGGSNVQVFIGI